jgi:hypothetical protein
MPRWRTCHRHRSAQLGQKQERKFGLGLFRLLRSELLPVWLTGGKFESNTLVAEQKGAAADPKDYANHEGVFSPHDDFIPALQQRGVVFLACHNAIWEFVEKLIATEVNPDKLSHNALAAELTNHLIAGVVLTPGISGTWLSCSRPGFDYGNSG